jgi:hypothetical protein
MLQRQQQQRQQQQQPQQFTVNAEVHRQLSQDGQHSQQQSWQQSPSTQFGDAGVATAPPSHSEFSSSWMHQNLAQQQQRQQNFHLPPVAPPLNVTGSFQPSQLQWQQPQWQQLPQPMTYQFQESADIQHISQNQSQP